MKLQLVALCLVTVISTNISAATSSKQSNSAINCPTGQCQDQIKKLKRFAKNGSRHAMALMGVLHYHGDGVEQNYKQAAYWFKKAIRKQSLQAKYYLSLMYREGNQVSKDVEYANELLNEAAEDEFVLALVDKGIQQYALSTTDSLKSAYQYFSKASELKSVKASYLLAKMTENGLGTNVDLVKAQTLYAMTAKYNYRDSMLHLDRLQSHLNTSQRLASSPVPDDNTEIIEVIGETFSLSQHLDFINSDIDKQKIYSRNSGSGSRIRGKVCDKWSNPPCKGSQGKKELSQLGAQR